MIRSGPEVADIFRRYGEAYRAQHTSLSAAQRRVMTAIELCRTAALGGHVEACDQCGHRRIAFNSCRDRHCPRCQSLARAQWLEDRRAELLDTQYFHVVFTLPEAIAAIAYQNKALVYGLLFRATAETLRTIAADPKHLGAEIGFFAVLHTWGQNLLHHPHLHCVVPGGGFSPDGTRWIACKPGFFLPVRVLSRLFRRLFLEHLEKAFDAGKLQFFTALQHLNECKAFRRYLAPLRKTDWVVYAKPPFAGPEQVLDYVGRYTHRVAISNNRLVDIEDGAVRFRWKDYRHGDRQKVMTVSADEFIRRFLLHVLPEGFHRIRYYGFLGNRYRAQKLACCREMLGMPISAPSDSRSEKDYRDRYEELTGRSLRQCPVCHQGHMIIIETFDGVTGPLRYWDTS
ncbi:IS91 family transposase [Sinorhizobium meliloti]|uniref:IS91 family transposase n=1 Tax=Rhizobium meliloti TaxID=382 RepID=UPI000B497B83|nr:IS91 family transposase [Sinorhizobium meliloti]ASQ06540.1 IS91 family transposase [Sinorhizobium meliloti]MDW9794350.1 IS91 family transposase [Sinorhizobium meliloti]MDW9831507.1 IS91 family transposase [Sinorhizobium meliloti]MDX0066889.1 IS91 family transposase [Sinorhizobium meliloti]MDX0085227.1 IS91 family transposase [Sinorhizobium meliloti]